VRFSDGGSRERTTPTIDAHDEPVYRQEQRGRPGTRTRYLRTVRPRFSVTATLDVDRVRADERSDGMFPLVSNDHALSRKAILEACKFQPKLEKRHEQLKSVQHVAPMWLKNVTRIEALLFVYFLALPVHALLERELRNGTANADVVSLPLYPDDRDCRAPTTERILELFAPLQRHRLLHNDQLVRIFQPERSPLQRRILRLLKIPVAVFKSES